MRSEHGIQDANIIAAMESGDKALAAKLAQEKLATPWIIAGIVALALYLLPKFLKR